MTHAHIQFRIVTPEGTVYSDDTVEQVSIPTSTGMITVLPEHSPLLSVLTPGELTIQKNGQPIVLAISGGMLEVRKNNAVYILADTAERAEHIDLERAEQARARAVQLMQEQKEVDDIEFTRLQVKIEKELNRLRIGRKYRHIQTR